MENLDTTENNEKKQNAKFPLKAVILLLLIGCVVYAFNNYTSKWSLVRYAKKELSAKGYEVLDVIVLDYSSASRRKGVAGKIGFVVKDKNGVKYVGNAIVDSEREWLIFDRKTFSINEISKAKD